MAVPAALASLVLALSLGLAGCAPSSDSGRGDGSEDASLEVSDVPSSKADDSAESGTSAGKKNVGSKEPQASSSSKDDSKDESSSSAVRTSSESRKESAKKAKQALDIAEDFSHKQFIHGEKPAKYQKYIVLHDTEGEGSAASVVSSWAASGNLIAAHFVVNRDGSIVQCVPLDKIAHHAGYGNPGKNKKYGVTDESRDDKLGPRKTTKSLPDYGMNSYSVGIEMVHATGGKDYTERQLKAVDGLIAFIDAYYGSESTIIDHKSWRAGNSDTSAAFAGYLKNYQDHRTHD